MCRCATRRGCCAAWARCCPACRGRCRARARGPLLLFGALSLLGLRDRLQTRRSVLRNYPVAGHMRYLLEYIRPEIRQYFIEPDREAAPFSRQQRSLVYQRAKGDPDKRPFGTQLDVHAHGYEWINHSMAPTRLPTHDFRVTIGAERAKPYSASIFNISAMSFGALSANAILALNGGAARGGFAHDTGEGSISQHHRVHGGDLIWEIGSGYFGCRHHDGRFNPEAFAAAARDPQVKMIELKLSQGAKPGHGGVLPGPKVTIEIAAGARRAGGRGLRQPGEPQRLFHPGADAASSSSGCASCRAASPPASSCASATRGNGSPSARPCCIPASCRTSSSSTAPKAAPARRRWSSPTTWARRCRKACCWCTTRCSG